MKTQTDSGPRREKRYHGNAELRIVPGDGGGPGTLVGYSVVYDSISQDLCGFREIIKPGCFAESLKSADVRCLIDHNPTFLLGRNVPGTLRLFDESKGLRIECDLPDVSYARDLVVTIEREDRDGMSFGFTALEDEWNLDDDGCMIRTVLKAEIFDVSAVTYPAYTDTSLALRSLDLWKASRLGPGDSLRRDRQKLSESFLRP
jgi:uncharacterized protein